MGEVKILGMRRLNDGRPLKAFVSVQIDGWTVNDFRIIQQNGQRAWVSPPQVSWKGDDGKLRYRPLLSMPPESQQRIEVTILSAWHKESA